MKPIVAIRSDACPLCGASNSIKALDVDDKSIDISRYIDANISIDCLRSKRIYKLYCKECHKYFFPTWIRGFPYPSTERDENLFLDRYEHLKNVDP